ncbi:MAG: HNH endonuclease, partial [Sandaracinaceae bacterium]|nr:HNH endonuclease [Sandaracinaceae bacterium]
CGLLGVSENERGAVLDVGRKTRSIPPALRRAVSLRDRGCRFPGCTCDRFIDCHHVEHWLEGGETRLDNLLSLCPFHHRLIHEGGWTLSFDGDEPTFRAPDRKPISAYVSAEMLRTEARAFFEAEHEELEIDDETGSCGWDGSRVDYEACVEAILRENET